MHDLPKFTDSEDMFTKRFVFRLSQVTIRAVSRSSPISSPLHTQVRVHTHTHITSPNTNSTQTDRRTDRQTDRQTDRHKKFPQTLYRRRAETVHKRGFDAHTSARAFFTWQPMMPRVSSPWQLHEKAGLSADILASQS